MEGKQLERYVINQIQDRLETSQNALKKRYDKMLYIIETLKTDGLPLSVIVRFKDLLKNTYADIFELYGEIYGLETALNHAKLMNYEEMEK